MWHDFDFIESGKEDQAGGSIAAPEQEISNNKYQVFMEIVKEIHYSQKKIARDFGDIPDFSILVSPFPKTLSWQRVSTDNKRLYFNKHVKYIVMVCRAFVVQDLSISPFAQRKSSQRIVLI